MSSVIPPIVIVEGVDVIVQPTVAAAESWLEPWWVANKEGAIYDATGCPLEASLDRESGTMKLSRSNEAPTADTLRAALVAYLAQSGRHSDPTRLQGLSLDLLIEMAANA